MKDFVLIKKLDFETFNVPVVRISEKVIRYRESDILEKIINKNLVKK